MKSSDKPWMQQQEEVRVNFGMVVKESAPAPSEPMKAEEVPPHQDADDQGEDADSSHSDSEQA